MEYSINDLLDILSYQRAAGSKMEQRFVRLYIDSIPGIRSDRFGNKFKYVGNSDTMFTSHTDTVHLGQCGRQRVYVRGNFAMSDGRNVLGADDGTGVWLMLNMIGYGAPGLYVFQRYEEKGGRGSSYSAEKERNYIKKVVSLDRKGYTDVITHQMGRTCSDKFANALARQLGNSYRPSSYGTFTDSENYSRIIPECTNISVGYFSEHTNMEKQDLVFARWLAKKLPTINFKSLPVDRDPTKIEPYNFGQGWTKNSGKWEYYDFSGNKNIKNKKDDMFDWWGYK